jgi:septal ring factor EnvC (AmiA/AmiB activator)
LIPTKPNHLDFEKSLVSKDDMPMMMKLGYFGETENARLTEELFQAQEILKKNSECFEQEKQELQAKRKAKADNNTKLQESLKELRNKCLKFSSSCVQ